MRRLPVSNADQIGAGTLLVGMWITVVVIITAFLATVITVSANNRQAQNVADLAAMSAALSWDGTKDPCPVAVRVTKESRGELLRCEVIGDGLEFVVSTKVKYRILNWEITATAHAGQYFNGPRPILSHAR